MSVVIGKIYIENLSHVSTKELKPVKAEAFYSALEATYGEKATDAASRTLLQQPDTTFAGVRAFKDRIASAIVNNQEISVEDQKYIENFVHMTAIRSLSQSKRQ